MKIYLNPELNKLLRKKINQNHNFIYNKKAIFKFPDNKNKETEAYNCICATLDRIDDIVGHCNNIQINNQFGLFDFFNYGQTLIDCITKLEQIFEISSRETDDISVFNKLGLDEKGNDDKYFRYLRSLCSVHPIDTRRHPSYQGDEIEWCPYILSTKSLSMKLLQYQNYDFVAVVYRNSNDLSRYVPISVNQIVAYVKKRYEYIKFITTEVEEYSQSLRKNFASIKLPELSDFTNYIDYLKCFKMLF